MTFYVVDEGVLMLTGYKTPDPLPAFSEPRTLGVFPIESREFLARILKCATASIFRYWALKSRKAPMPTRATKSVAAARCPGACARTFARPFILKRGTPSAATANRHFASNCRTI